MIIENEVIMYFKIGENVNIGITFDMTSQLTGFESLAQESYLNQESASSYPEKIEKLTANPIFSEERGEEFLQIINNMNDPNFIFSMISIGENQFRYATCFHVVYLYWKNPSI